MSVGTGATDRLVIVSADGHAGPEPEEYRSYLDRAALEHFDDFVDDSNRYVTALYDVVHYSDETIEMIDDRNAIRTGGTTGVWDVQRRLREMDDEGVAAELVIFNHQLAGQPFFSPVCRPWGPELRAAGVRAFHRWIADYKSAAPERFLAMAESGPCIDMDATVREIRWAAEHGFKLMELPGLCADPDLPPLFSDYFEPLWRTCADSGMALALHAGWGQAQGKSIEQWEKYVAEAGVIDDFDLAMVPREREARSTMDDENPTSIDVSVARAMWQLMLGGVFDRHPELRLVLIEVRAGWVPSTLARLDARFAEGDTGMRRKPSEYYESNVWVAPSFVQRAEIEMRHEIGVSKMMFARDYPHLEGTWPNTHDWIRAALAGVSIDEGRRILGENAIECFRLDRDVLARIAERIGPRPEELLGMHAVRPELVDHFDARGGFRKPPLLFDDGAIDRHLADDISALMSTQ